MLLAKDDMNSPVIANAPPVITTGRTPKWWARAPDKGAENCTEYGTLSIQE